MPPSTPIILINKYIYKNKDDNNKSDKSNNCIEFIKYIKNFNKNENKSKLVVDFNTYNK